MSLWVVLLGGLAVAQEFSGVARLDARVSGITDQRRGFAMELSLSQGVPYRAFTLAGPARLVLDFREVDWDGLDGDELDQSDRVSGVRVGAFQPGWSRMVVDMAAPHLLDSADLALDAESGRALLRVVMREGSAGDFAAAAGMPDLPGWGLPEGLAAQIRPRQRGEGPLVVMLDPGHGGIDPGAERAGLREKDLMLQFARELKEALVRAGGFEVVLTREDDRFVSLERRVALAQQAGADVMFSLHADVLREGQAKGIAVYMLSDSASDAASAALAERHDRGDILAGIDLKGHDDVVADVLIDLARQETQPRARLLSEALVLGFQEYELRLNSRPIRSAGFSVLKSPDIPSVLVELGFLSSPRDLENLNDSDWRGRLAQSFVDALKAWRIADAAAADLVRQ